MKRSRVLQVLVLVMFVCPAFGEVVEVNLFTLGCPTLFDPNHSWSSGIDLGVEFTQIDHVYMDWAGEITAGIAVDNDDPDNPYPLDVVIKASLGANPWPRATDVWGGEATYPDPQPFDSFSEFSLLNDSTWSDLLDGQGTISINYHELILVDGAYIEDGSVTVTDVILVVDGTIIPEPTTITFLVAGIFAIRHRSFKKRK